MSLTLNTKSLYKNKGNPSILKFLDKNDSLILDVGCGAGDTAQLIRSNYPQTKVTGITCSAIEQEQAQEKLDECICIDIERDYLPSTVTKQFDVLIFSHVLEHLVNPVPVIRKLLPLLKADGKIIVALPNIANWRDRCKLALGKFEYTEDGIMDKTHLHFYTFYTAIEYLLAPIKELKIEEHLATGSIPLAFFRHYLLPKSTKRLLDEMGSKYMPNLFGREILIVAKYMPD